MNAINWLIFMGITFVLVLEIPTLTSTRIMAQDENTTMFQSKNNDSVIWNMKDKTINIVNGTTNETKTIGNFTTNETISIRNVTADTENMITNESTSSSNVTGNAENSTANLNLTNKFKQLQGQ